MKITEFSHLYIVKVEQDELIDFRVSLENWIFNLWVFLFQINFNELYYH